VYSIMCDTPKVRQKSGDSRGLAAQPGPVRRVVRRRLASAATRNPRGHTGHDFTAPVGPHGRVILKIAADKVNTPRLLGH
jgi:hypothetical protein